MQKTEKELRRELAKIEKQKEENKGTHQLTVMNKKYEMFEISVSPRNDFDAAEKAKITSLISMLEKSSKTMTRIVNKGKKAKVSEWVEVITLLDLIFEDIFTIVYDIEDYKTPSLPNMDLFEIFLTDNEDFLKEQAKALTEQLNNLAETYNEKG